MLITWRRYREKLYPESGEGSGPLKQQRSDIDVDIPQQVQAECILYGGQKRRKS